MRKILKPALIILGAAILFAVFAVSFWNYLPFKNLLSFKKLTASLLQISQKEITRRPILRKAEYCNGPIITEKTAGSRLWR